MSRSVSNINDYITATLVTNFAAIGITINPTLWSKRNLLRAICYTIAICQAYFEQLQDLFIQNVETFVNKSAASSPTWIQDKMFKFQYSATNPQVIALIDTVPTYPVVDEKLRIITACSVTSDISNIVAIKVAKSSPLESLSAQELISAQGYINTIGMSGINYTVISLSPDQIYIEANVYFAGQYAAVIKQQLIAAIIKFLETLSVTNFNGALKMTDLESVIRNTAGVNDVVLLNVRGRASTDPYSAGIDLILNTAVIQKQYVSIAGYLSAEYTDLKNLKYSLHFIAE